MDSENPVLLATNYQQQIQGLIYNLLTDPLMQAFLHDHGFDYNQRRFKLFTFSRLMGKSYFNQQDKTLRITPPVLLYISSPWTEFLENLANSLLARGFIQIGKNQLQVKEIKLAVTPPFNQDQSYPVKMLSPVTMYSTLETREGSKKTYYYSPTEREFTRLIAQNLVKKASAFYGEDWSKLFFCIEVANSFRASQQKIIIYKGTVIKGWLGNYHISGHPKMLKLAYESGIGSKNSQGFGLFELCNNG